MVYKFFLKKQQNKTGAETSGLDQELRKRVIKKFHKRKVYAGFKENIWAVDLPETRSLFFFNRGVKYIF